MLDCPDPEVCGTLCACVYICDHLQQCAFIGGCALASAACVAYKVLLLMMSCLLDRVWVVDH